MGHIRTIETEQEANQFAAIAARAYPRIPQDRLLESIQNTQTKDPQSNYYIYIEDNEVKAGMRLITYQMNLYGSFIKVGGVGTVAVDLLYKKRRIAKQLIEYFLAWCQKQGAHLAILYPFRPDFYFKMGFGYGPVMASYSFTPHSLPFANQREGLVTLKPHDLALMQECYERFAQKQHGYCLRSDYEAERILTKYLESGRAIGYKNNGRLEGYLTFASKAINQANMLQNYLNIKEWLWHTPQALQQLCDFLYVQADQYERIIYTTQQEDFYYILKDARNGSNNLIPSVYHESYQAGVGLMYRIVDVAGFLQQIARAKKFGAVSAQIKLAVEDTFMEQNNKTVGLKFSHGKLEVGACLPAATEIKISVNNLASLLMGSADIKTLQKLGLIQTSETVQETLNSLFATTEKPQCITAF